MSENHNFNKNDIQSFLKPFLSLTHKSDKLPPCDVTVNPIRDVMSSLNFFFDFLTKLFHVLDFKNSSQRSGTNFIDIINYNYTKKLDSFLLFLLSYYFTMYETV